MVEMVIRRRRRTGRNRRRSETLARVFCAYFSVLRKNIHEYMRANFPAGNDRAMMPRLTFSSKLAFILQIFTMFNKMMPDRAFHSISAHLPPPFGGTARGGRPAAATFNPYMS
jgi:hypothetical protein